MLTPTAFLSFIDQRLLWPLLWHPTRESEILHKLGIRPHGSEYSATNPQPKASPRRRGDREAPRRKQEANYHLRDSEARRKNRKGRPGDRVLRWREMSANGPRPRRRTGDRSLTRE